MNKFHLTLAVLALSVAAALPPRTVSAYPPAVGILGQSRDCLACHADNGPWRDDSRLIIDILDQASGNSLKQKDGTFLISTKRGEAKTVLTVIGRAQGDDAPAPYRTGWLYVDPQRITEIGPLTKFARGWSVNLPMACRLVGDASKAYPGAQLTVLPMTVRPGDDAQDAEIELQFMLTKGESVKGKPKQGMLGNYFVRQVRLTVASAKEPARSCSAARLSGVETGDAASFSWRCSTSRKGPRWEQIRMVRRADPTRLVLRLRGGHAGRGGPGPLGLGDTDCVGVWNRVPHLPRRPPCPEHRLRASRT